MTVISGKDAYVENVPCTTSWSASHLAAPVRYAASCTDGGTGVVVGNENWQGTMAGLGPNPPVIPGKSFSFNGIIDNTSGDAKALVGTILIENVQIQFPVAGGGPITWTASFGVQGALVDSTSGADDSTTQLAISAKDTTILIDPAPGSNITPVEVQNVSLSFAAPATTYIKDGLTYRTEGNLQADLSFALFNRDLFVAGYQPNERHKVHIICDDAKFWLLDDVVFSGLNNFTVDVQTRAIVGYTVNGMWSAVTDEDAAGALTAPDGTVWFPIAA